MHLRGRDLFSRFRSLIIQNLLTTYYFLSLSLVSYFQIPEEEEFKTKHPGLQKLWAKFVNGDQTYRDKRLKLLPVVVEGPWICQRAIGAGNAPAVIGKALPVQYYHEPGKYFELDLCVMASSVARGILSIVKSHTKSITIDLAFIIEGNGVEELPENVLSAFRLHSLDPDKAQMLPKHNFVDEPYVKA